MKFEDVQSLSANYSGGWFRRSGIDADSGCLNLTRSVKDVETDGVRVALDTYYVSGESDDSIFQLSSTDINKFAVYDIALSGTKRVIIGNSTADNKVYIDIECDGFHSRVDASSVHGKPVADTWFGGCSWSPDERYFCYVAQPLTPAPADAASKAFSEKHTEFVVQETKFDYKGGDWGEKYVRVSQFVICVLDTATGQVRTVPGVDTENGCPGQPVFVSRGSSIGIVYTSWSTKPRRMGILMCYHRPCRLFHIDLTSFLSTQGPGTSTLSHSCITTDIALARSARFNNSQCGDSGCLVFLGRSTPLQTHNGSVQLFAIDVATSKTAGGVTFSNPRVAVDLVNTPNVRGRVMEFPGLFCDQLPRRCFVADYVVALTTAWGSSDAVIVVSVGDCCLNHITRLSCLLSILPQEHGAASAGDPECAHLHASCAVVEAVCHGPTGSSDILFVTSRPNCPQQFGLYTHQFAPAHTGASNVRLATPRGHEETVLQHGCVISCKSSKLTHAVATVKPEAASTGPSIRDHYTAVRSQVSKLQWSVLQLSEPPSTGEPAIPFDAIVLHPSTNEEGAAPLPVVMVPHGGPHSVFTTNFAVMAPYVYLSLSLNACVVLVNYRGSVGFGEASVRSLPGHIGDSDLTDMLAVMRHLRDDAGDSLKLDFNRCCIVGGSHGGFLTATAIGKHPGLFRAAAMRNPVTNIPAMFTVSDIPDWCVVECMGWGAEASSEDREGASVYDFDQFRAPNQSELAAMYTKSPIQYVPHVVTPTLLLLGAKDRRVPMCQGIEYYHALKHSLNVRSGGAGTAPELKCMVFPEDTHAIDCPGSEVSHWTAVKEWFARHTA